MPIIVNVDVLLARRKMRLNTLAELVGITPQIYPCSRPDAPRLFALVPWSGCARCSIASPGTFFFFEKGAAVSEDTTQKSKRVPSAS